MARPTYKQITYIHLLKNKLGWSDVEYQSHLQQRCHVTSSTKLTPRQCQTFIDYMLALLGDAFTPTSKPQAAKALPAGDTATPGRLTDKQRNMIVNLWWKVSRGQTPLEKRHGLHAFIKRQTGCDALKFVPRGQAAALICALQTMECNLNTSKEAVNG